MGEKEPSREPQKLKPRWFGFKTDVYGDPSPGCRSETWQGTLGDVLGQKGLEPKISKTGKALLHVKDVRAFEGALYAFTEVGWVRWPRQRK